MEAPLIIADVIDNDVTIIGGKAGLAMRTDADIDPMINILPIVWIIIFFFFILFSLISISDSFLVKYSLDFSDGVLLTCSLSNIYKIYIIYFQTKCDIVTP